MGRWMSGLANALRKTTASAGKPAAAKSSSADDIMAQIDAKKSELQRLANLQYELAEKSVTDPDAERRYFQCIDDSVASQRDLERLQAALAGVQHRAHVDASTARATARRGQLVEFEAALGRRLASIADLANAIAAAGNAYAAFVQETERLGFHLPAGANLPTGLEGFEYQIGGRALPVSLSAAVAAEMHRIAEMPQFRLPGAKA